ncbi:MAG TPA: cell wall hydrolase [Clostridiales bacterium]|nr:cell wall hydrolase [Clostridiales bacterium]HBR07965.1 cell wall hydrolase [Clostridiales bacterium]
MPMSTRELFARMIKCEAGGEGLDGMKAVASTIMNRVHVAYGEYLRVGQGDLRRILEQPYQFTCYLTEVGGQPNPQNIWNIPAEDIHYQVADWALAGNVHPGVVETLWYMNPFAIQCPPYFPYNKSGVQFNRITQHCFYQPTTLYALT